MTYIAAVAPEALVVAISRGQLAVDFSTATGGSFEVMKPGATVTVSWAGIVSGAGPNALTLTHGYQVGDLDVAGDYIIVPKILFPSGSVLCRRIVKTFTNPFV